VTVKYLHFAERKDFEGREYNGGQVWNIKKGDIQSYGSPKNVKRRKTILLLKYYYKMRFFYSSTVN
jgi:hypothetical protein